VGSNFSSPSWRKMPETAATMKPLVQIKQPVPHLRGSALLISLVLACFAFPQRAPAVVPAPDGGYPGFNTAEGQNALFGLATGSANTAVGWYSLFSNAVGSFNTATGAGALLFNTADANTALGAAALLFNTTGINNTAVGAAALLHNTIAEENTATGAFALSSNTEGDFNTATGAFALWLNTTGERNTATGDSAMFSNTEGNNNTATGNAALGLNTAGNDNTATGYFALRNNTTGDENTANGRSALASNTIGNGNTAYGREALSSNTFGGANTAIGDDALAGNITGSGNTALGAAAGALLTTGNGNVCIGANVYGVAGESDTTRISNIYPSVANGRVVYVNSDNKIGTLASSRRFKEEIKPMDKASEALFELKPVTFHYKKQIDPMQALSFGLIAEEVAKINPELITRDKDGKPETVRYEAVNAMLLNEFLKEHRKVEQQEANIAQQRRYFEATITELKRELETVVAHLKEHDSKIQKVSDQIEVTKPAPQVVLNNP
jgi:hypothetical protein